MKNILFICTALMALTFSTAKANEGFYAGAFGGANWTDISNHHDHIDFKTGFLGGASLGYKFCNGFSLEGEIAYRRNKIDHLKIDGVKYSFGGNLRTWSYMANGYYEIPICDFCVKPYVGAGIGYANQRISLSDSGSKAHANENGFAYQLIAGIAYPICDNVDLDLEYRYFHGKEHVNNNSVSLGLKYMF